MMIDNQKQLSGLALRVIATLVLLSCSPYADSIYDSPRFKISVHNGLAPVGFEFFREEKSEVSSGRVAVRIYFLDVYYQTEGGYSHAIWRILSPSEQNIAAQITYGVVPEGFKQIIPEKGTAPPLETGIKYFVLARGEGGFGFNSFTVK